MRKETNWVLMEVFLYFFVAFLNSNFPKIVNSYKNEGRGRGGRWVSRGISP